MKPNPFNRLNRHKFLKTAHFISFWGLQQQKTRKEWFWETVVRSIPPGFMSLLPFPALLRSSQLHVFASSPKFVKTMIFQLCAPENEENTRFETRTEIQLVHALLRLSGKRSWRKAMTKSNGPNTPWERTQGESILGILGPVSQSISQSVLVFQLVTVKNFKINGFEKMRSSSRYWGSTSRTFPFRHALPSRRCNFYRLERRP